MTPLGWPVDPLVYTISATRLGSIRGSATASCGSRWRSSAPRRGTSMPSRTGPTRSRAPESDIWYPASRGVKVGLMGVTAAPTRHAPRMATSSSIELGSITATHRSVADAQGAQLLREPGRLALEASVAQLTTHIADGGGIGSGRRTVPGQLRQTRMGVHGHGSSSSSTLTAGGHVRVSRREKTSHRQKRPIPPAPCALCTGECADEPVCHADAASARDDIRSDWRHAEDPRVLLLLVVEPDRAVRGGSRADRRPARTQSGPLRCPSRRAQRPLGAADAVVQGRQCR